MREVRQLLIVAARNTGRSRYIARGRRGAGSYGVPPRCYAFLVVDVQPLEPTPPLGPFLTLDAPIPPSVR